jgi:hypothetical protein
MTFNLKNKKAQIGFGTPGAVGTLKQITVDDITNAKSDEELDKIQNILNQNGIQNPELIEALESQKGVLQTQKSTQGLTGVLPVKENAPMTVMPSGHSAKNNVFNLKKYAQQALAPMDPMTDQTIIKFKDGASVRQWLDGQSDLQGALQYLVGFDDESGSIDLVKELIGDYFTAKGDPMTEPRVLEKKAGEIFDVLPAVLKEEPDITGVPKHVGEIQETIKKLAKEHIQSLPVTSYNLKKVAQHKTLDNAILWGPSPKPRIDPFLHQPISDWHIVERNKGFGLVVDDIWNIDYETIWRQNIMDKYSQPYRDKDGNWVGGYIQKRFEVDKNIPNSTNMQLKPGQRRKPILPEYGNTESRLQAARANGDIEGALDTTKPFNWKEASSKKKS